MSAAHPGTPAGRLQLPAGDYVIMTSLINNWTGYTVPLYQWEHL